MKGIEKFRKKIYESETGSVLVIVLLFLLVMSGMAFYFMMISTTEQMISRNRIDDAITFLAADAGVAYALSRLAFKDYWEEQHLRNDSDGAGGYIMRRDGFTKKPYECWDEETIPLPDNSYAYVRTWVEWDDRADPDYPGGRRKETFILSQANYGTASKIVEAQYYFPIEVFNFAYFGLEAIHLDNHGVDAKLSIVSSGWTNGEFEMDGGMVMRARKGDFFGAGGHVSIGGTIYSNIYAPSIDTYGPDAQGFNYTADCYVHDNCWGTIYGNVYLMDGYIRNPDYTLDDTEPRFLFRDPTKIDPTYCADGGAGSTGYGRYATVAASWGDKDPGSDPNTANGRPGPQTAVMVCTDTLNIEPNRSPPPAGKSCYNIKDDPGPPIKPSKTYSYSGVGPDPYPGAPFDPNERPRYAYRLPNRGGKVLLYRDFPKVDWQSLYDQATAEETILPARKSNRERYLLGNFDQITNEPYPWSSPSGTVRYDETIGNTEYVVLGRKDPSTGNFLPSIWYIGNGPEYDGNDDLIMSSVQDLNDDVGGGYQQPWALRYYKQKDGTCITRGVIVHGCIVVEGYISSPEDAGCHIYGCGNYDFYDNNGNGVYDVGEPLGHDPSEFDTNPPDSSTSDFPADLISWFKDSSLGHNFFANEGPPVGEHATSGVDQVYALPAFIVGSNKNSDQGPSINFVGREAKDNPNAIECPDLSSVNTAYMFIHGAIFTYGQSKMQPNGGNTSTPGSTDPYAIKSVYFIYGSQVAGSIHNNRYIAFEYDDCVIDSATGIFMSENRDLVEVINWRTLTEVQGVN